ncbi:hypothetical protein GcM1_246018 [Golovinomyces cichoracearum]|uniref:Guanine nucleotide exchange factor LTE1 n=1 Tax=Golovinomyces cichoracearum TaxID=62708 RepID=A0A420IE32_9PEZI|nr:hypothetical protein GcM1_246018 [Golovinomyces cichoracearum]
MAGPELLAPVPQLKNRSTWSFPPQDQTIKRKNSDSSCTRHMRFSETVQYDNFCSDLGNFLCPETETKLIHSRSNKFLRKNYEKIDQTRKITSNSSCQNVSKLARVGDTMLRIPDSREGRLFTVSKVGNNGKIYLCPTNRPANENHTISPKISPSRESLNTTSSDYFRQNTKGLTYAPYPLANDDPRYSTTFTDTQSHTRPTSSSNVSEVTVAVDYNAKYTIGSTLNQFSDESNSLPTLQIRIPSYRLGSPQFSTKGSASLVQGSSRQHSDLSPHSYLSNKSQPSFLDVRKTDSRDTFRQLPAIIEIFDALSLNTSCENSESVHRSVSGKLLAATPPRLVAEITSPALVDYDLLSDFFLTFRSFLDTKDLMYMLIARLVWSSLRSDSLGTVVSVRTFVAIRHWLLNYFLDDFLKDRELCKLFCDLVNDFVNQKAPHPSRSKVSLKIVGELKKCWRSLCTVYRKSPNCFGHLESDPAENNEGVDFQDINYDINFHEDLFHHESEERNLGISQFILADSELNFERQQILTENLNIESVDTVSPLTDDIQCKAPTSPQHISSDEISYSLNNCHKSAKSEGGRIGCSISKKSILQIGSSIRLLNKSNEKFEQSHQPKSESGKERCRCQQTSPKEKDQINAHPFAIPLADSHGRGKLLRSKRSALRSNNTPSTEELNTHNDRFQCIGNPKRVTPAREPGIKKLISSVRHAFSSTTDQIGSSLHIQSCFPQTVPLHTRDDNSNHFPDPATVTNDTSDSKPIRNIKRIDILSAMIARELEDVCKKSDSRFDRRNLIESTLIHGSTPNAQVKYVRDPDSIVQSDKDDLDHHSMSNKTIYDYGSSTSRSFILSDFSYYPSVDTFATACMRPNLGLTPPITPTHRFPCTDRENLDSMAIEKGDNTPLSEDTPSLVVDSSSSVEDERSAPSNSPLFEGVDHSSLGVSFDSEISSQLHTLYLDNTNWKNEHNPRKNAVSETIIESRENSLHRTSKPVCSKPLRRRPGGYLRSPGNLDLSSSQLHPGQISPDLQLIDSPRSPAQKINPNHNHAVNFRKDYDRDYRISSEISVSHSGSHVGLQSKFEKEVQLLAQLPDDDEDCGTVEAALLKLEGKFDKAQPDYSESTSYWSNIQSLDQLQNFNFCNSSPAAEENDKLKNRKYVLKANLLNSPPVLEAHQLGHNNLAKSESEKIDNSQDLPKISTPAIELSNIVIPDNSISFWQSFDTEKASLNRMSYQSVVKNVKERSGAVESRFEHPELALDTITPTKIEQNSDEVSQKSDILKSKKISSFDADNNEGSNFFRIMNESAQCTINTHNDHSSRIIRPFPSIEACNSKESLDDKILDSPSVQTTLQPKFDSKMDFESVNTRSSYIVSNSKFDNSEVSLPQSQSRELRSYRGASISMNPLRLHRISQIPKEKTSTHLPFIFVFNPEILAQQFTLVEKDVISQIDWKDLAEMHWKDVSLNTTSWVSYLESKNPPHGVQAFFTRFNLMIKWVTSECVLTQDTSERANCLVKFIHIADKCRKIRNFATMIQIVAALTSEDIVGLTNTWVQVPSTEIQTLQELAAIVLSQSRHILRAEMESSNLENGCIPFLQIYTKDLHENSKNPIQVISSSGSGLMVDFENCRKNALAIKTILRLLEASQNYRFSPIKDIFERCYWIAALDNEQILTCRKLIQD